MRDSIVIVSPCYNENTTVIKFLIELENILARSDKSFIVVVVDDSSIDNTLALLQEHVFTIKNAELKVISLKYNLGHQGAIYQGISYARTLGAEHVIVMDSDGEDDPWAVLELTKYLDQDIDIINVVRGKRKEKLSFRVFYRFYKAIFYLITKRAMNFGNYCMINRRIIDTTVETSFIHFAAHLSKLKARRAKILFDRRSRIDGKSKMNLDSLIHHAFKSFIEYAEDLLMVFLKLFLLISLMIIGLTLYVVYQKIFTNNAILGWASTISATFINTALICLGFFVMGILLLNIMAKNDSRHKENLYKEIK